MGRNSLRSPRGETLSESQRIRSNVSDSMRLLRTGKESQLVLFDGKRLKTTILDRESLVTGKKYSGPAVITEYSATTVVPPRTRFFLDRAANLIIAIEESPAPRPSTAT